MLLLHGGVQPIKIREVRDIPLHPGDMVADLPYCGIQFTLTATGDVNIGALCDEALGRGEANTAATTCNDGDFSFQFVHVASPILTVSLGSRIRFVVVWL